MAHQLLLRLPTWGDLAPNLKPTLRTTCTRRNSNVTDTKVVATSCVEERRLGQTLKFWNVTTGDQSGHAHSVIHYYGSIGYPASVTHFDAISATDLEASTEATEAGSTPGTAQFFQVQKDRLLG